MKGNPFLKRFSFVRHLGLSKEELKWLEVQVEKVDDGRRYGLLLEFMLTLQDESKVAAFRWLADITNDAEAVALMDDDDDG
jgi:hypothetical protein